MPEIENLTRFAATDLPSLDRHGRGLLLVCVCGRFALPLPGKAAAEISQPSEDQPPPAMEDAYWGEPGGSSLKHEGQSCYCRPGTDIYMNGSAWARLGRPTTAVAVSLRVGPCQRQIVAIGDRFWRRGTLQGVHFSSPEPFVSLPLVYERAFGGAAAADLWESRNPVGRGYYRNTKEALDRPLPNIEDPNELLESLQRNQPEDGRRKQALCTAMGILGAPEFIPGLIERLEKETEDGVRLAAAEALQRITGAGLRETAPEPPDELADSEPSDSDPAPEDSAEENADATPGDEEKRRVVERTSTDPQAWAKWWAEHRRAFSAGTRIRLGRPFQLEVCVDEAATASSPQQTRALAMRELAMRSAEQNVECGGCEPDWYVEQQMRALSSWREWCTANGRTGKNRR